LNGDQGASAAGEVIESFGNFVVGGNFIVGTVVFIILVMINFIVITKGSVRTSEVAARFTLDAIPGKQMSIDADLNAGLITEQDARTRRRNLEREADFYGSMDGSIRFVRGDAIAGILITLVNILGGFAIGVFQQGMEASEAAQDSPLVFFNKAWKLRKRLKFILCLRLVMDWFLSCLRWWFLQRLVW